MKSHTHYLWFNTKQRQEIIDMTDQAAEQVRESGVAEGHPRGSATTATTRVSLHHSVRHFPDPSEEVCRLITNQPWSLLTQSIDLSSPSLASSLQQSNVPAGTVTRSLPVTRRSSAVNVGNLV